jgi:hypothetical protein
MKNGLRRARLGLLTLACVVLPSLLSGQQPILAESLARARFLLGRWEGASEGQPGRGKVQREYSPALNGRFIRVRNRTEYAAQARNPKGEVHEDEGFISFDRSRKKLVLRQFHLEGFVNQYVENSPTPGAALVFTTESIENIPAGWRARETYIVHGPEEIEEVFELAEGGKPFEVYSRSRMKRVR